MNQKDRPAAILLTLFVWGLAGALFGSLFAALHELLIVLGLEGWGPVLAATTIAAVTTSAFYSAMPVALVGAMAGVLASLGTLMVGGHQLRLITIVGFAAAAGTVAGGFYGWINRSGGRPLAEALTGLLAGLVAGGLLSLGLALYGAPVAMLVMAACIVALVGSLFQLTERRLTGKISGWLPSFLSAPVVAGLIAAVVGASIWVVGGTTAMALDLESKMAIDQVLQQVPSGFLGGMLGGAVAGVLLELAGAHLEDHDQAV
jgi:hypothetical protein